MIVIVIMNDYIYWLRISAHRKIMSFWKTVP